MQILSASDGFPTANAVIVGASSGSVDVSVSDYSDVIIDVNGYFQDGNGYAFYPLPTSCRAVETQNATGSTGGARARNTAIREVVNTYKGNVVHPAVAESQGMPWKDLSAVM